MIIFIVAHDSIRGIGLNGRVPWPRMQADRERLHQLTSGKVLAMGRKSYDEFKEVKHAFSPKEVLVISRSQTEGVATTLEEVRSRAKNEDIWLLGGGDIFQELLPDAQKIYLTKIDSTFDADTFFPKLKMNEWKITKSKKYKSDAQNPHDYTFEVLERVV